MVLIFFFDFLLLFKRRLKISLTADRCLTISGDLFSLLSYSVVSRYLQALSVILP